MDGGCEVQAVKDAKKRAAEGVEENVGSSLTIAVIILFLLSCVKTNISQDTIHFSVFCCSRLLLLLLSLTFYCCCCCCYH